MYFIQLFTTFCNKIYHYDFINNKIMILIIITIIIAIYNNNNSNREY